MPAADIKDPELRIHALAYMDIFRHVLKKYPDGHPQKEAALSRLSDYIEKNITSPDAFIDHIPVFSKGLGVAPGPLGAFIGSQFVKALSNARKTADSQMASVKAPAAQAASVSAGQPRSGKKQYSTIMDEIAELYSLQPPGRFTEGDLGTLILERPDGIKVLPGTLPPAAVPVTGKAAPVYEDKPIIAEILEKFGSVLNVHEKLEFNPFPPEMQGGSPMPAVFEEEAPGPVTGGAAPAPAIVKTTPASGYRPLADAPIIADILEKFGSKLNVTDKLIPLTGITEGESGFTPDFGGSQTDSADSGEEWSGEESPGGDLSDSIPFYYEDYIEIMKALQGYQASGNKAAYESWLKSPDNANAGILVNLRNREGREKKGEMVNWEVEYFNIAMDHNYQKDQIRQFHDTMKKFDRVQRLFAHFTEKMKGAHPRIMNELKKIWPQIRMLPGIGDNYTSYITQLKIILLQVQDQPVKAKLLEIMDPYLKKTAEIMEG